MPYRPMLVAAMHHLSENSCSERELLQRLEKEFSGVTDFDQILQTTVQRLHQLNLINDRRIAHRIAQHFSHKGDRFICCLLEQQGIEKPTIASVLQDIGDEYSRALDEAKRKLHEESCTNVGHTETAIMRFLSGRHFSFSTVKKVIEHLQQTFSIDNNRYKEVL